MDVEPTIKEINDSVRKLKGFMRTGRVPPAEPGNLPHLCLYEMILNLDPANEAALFNAGLWGQMTGNHHTAIKYWERLIEKYPEQWKGHAQLIQSLSAAGRREERDARVEELRAAWNSGIHPELSAKPFFIRDVMYAGGRKFFVLEYYQLKSPLGVLWKFLEDTESKIPPDFVISLGSYDEITEMERALGVIPEDGRSYHLDRYGSEGSHFTYSMFNSLPDYDYIKALVELHLAKFQRPSA